MSVFQTVPVRDGPVCKLPHFFFMLLLLLFSLGPLLDWIGQTLLYSYWSTETECSEHSRSKQPPTKLYAPLYRCTDGLYIHMVLMKPCGCCLQLTKHVNLISDESILVVVFVRVNKCRRTRIIQN